MDNLLTEFLDSLVLAKLAVALFDPLLKTLLPLGFHATTFLLPFLPPFSLNFLYFLSVSFLLSFLRFLCSSG